MADLPGRRTGSCTEEPVTLGNVMVMSDTHTHTRSNQNNVKMTARSQENISLSPNRLKLPNSLYGAKDQCIGKAEGLENVAYVLTICMNMQSDETSMKSQADTSKYTE